MGHIQKKIALFSALSGYGRCSITVSLPIISRLGIQCCPVPTAILSNHSGYPEYFIEDYSDRLTEYLAHWKKLSLSFDGICTGFLGNQKQVSIVRDFIESFRTPSTIVIIDPVLGDDGKLYSSCSVELCDQIKSLISLADIITPNLTEACLLTDLPKTAPLEDIISRLRRDTNKKIVITGIRKDNLIGNYCSEPGVPAEWVTTPFVGRSRNGTGDIFTAIIASDAINGVSLVTSVKRAAAFVSSCILASEEWGIHPSDGVCFEKVLPNLQIDIPEE